MSVLPDPLMMPFDAIGVRVETDGSIGLVFMKDGREMYRSDTRHLIRGDIMTMTGVHGTLKLTTA